MLFWIALAACSTSVPDQASASDQTARASKSGKRGKAGKFKEKVQGEGCVAGVMATEGWSGEYPEPVVEVTSTVTIKGRQEACSRLPMLSCELAPGLYHPWSDRQMAFSTIRGVERYKVLRDLQIGGSQVAANKVVTLIKPLSEGFCIYEIAGVEVEAECPDVMTKPGGPKLFEKQSHIQMEPRQMMQASCADGTKAWIEVEDALFANEAIRKGKVTGFGTIAGAD